MDVNSELIKGYVMLSHIGIVTHHSMKKDLFPLVKIPIILELEIGLQHVRGGGS